MLQTNLMHILTASGHQKLIEENDNVMICQVTTVASDGTIAALSAIEYLRTNE